MLPFDFEHANPDLQISTPNLGTLTLNDPTLGPSKRPPHTDGLPTPTYVCPLRRQEARCGVPRGAHQPAR
eukprot:3949077-Lingulodinium_polyedra.AAC.1